MRKVQLRVKGDETEDPAREVVVLARFDREEIWIKARSVVRRNIGR